MEYKNTQRCLELQLLIELNWPPEKVKMTHPRPQPNGSLIPLAWSPVGLYLNRYTHASGRTDVSAAAKEREERVRRLREQQEDERKKKLEELKQHVRL